jgi:biotin carboxylase
MKKRLLMLGAGFMQGVAIRCAKERGWEVVVVDGNPEASCRDLADRFEPIDLKDREALARFALGLKAKGGLDAVFTAATDFSASVSYVAEACGLPGHSFEASRNASDKLRMRECFARAGVPSPLFVGVSGETAGNAGALMHGKGFSLPVVVKPCDNMGARGCRLVRTQDELDAAIADAIRYSRSGNAIIEQYMEGPEFSIEALVFDGEIHLTGLAVRHICFPPYFIEMGHTIPADLSPEDEKKIIDVFHRGIRALGLSWGAAKGDIKLTPTGPMIGEIAGRLSGGYMSGWTFPYSSGIDLTGAALGLAAGIRPESLKPLHAWVSAERAWISIPGVVASVSGYNRARTVPYIRDIFPRASPGDAVFFPLNNVEKCGNCIASAPSRDLAVKAAECACQAIVIRLAPRNPDTDAFLAGGPKGADSFPPDAFASIPPDYDRTLSSGLSVKDVRLPIPSGIMSALDTATDWQGRTAREALTLAVSLEPDLATSLAAMPAPVVSSCWDAFVRGGLQGLLYRYDCDAR